MKDIIYKRYVAHKYMKIVWVSTTMWEFHSRVQGSANMNNVIAIFDK